MYIKWVACMHTSTMIHYGAYMQNCECIHFFILCNLFQPILIFVDCTMYTVQYSESYHIWFALRLFSSRFQQFPIHFLSFLFHLQFNFRFSPYFRICLHSGLCPIRYKLMRKHYHPSVWIIVPVWFHFYLNQCSNLEEIPTLFLPEWLPWMMICVDSQIPRGSII